MRCDELTDLLAEVADWRVDADGPVADAEPAATSSAACGARPTWSSTASCSGPCTTSAPRCSSRPPACCPSILAHLEAAGERHAVRSMLTGRRLAYAGGIAAAATAAGAGAAIILATRGRRLKTAS